MEARRQTISVIFKDFMTGIAKLEELGNAAHTFLLRLQQGLSLLRRPPIVTSSKLIDDIIKNNETIRLKSYIEAGFINIHDSLQSTRALHTSLSGLSDHLIKDAEMAAQSLLIELERLTDEAAFGIESASKFSTELDKESSDESQQVTCADEKVTVPSSREAEITEYATLIGILYSMVKQNYAMQENIVRSLSLNSSSGELETYTLLWALRPFVEDEIMKRAWKVIY